MDFSLYRIFGTKLWLDVEDKSRNHIIKGFVTVISVLAQILIIKFSSILYQVNDDVCFAGILSGVYSGEPSAMTVFVGYLYGLAIAGLYSLVPSVEWYALAMHVLYMLAFMVVGYRILGIGNRILRFSLYLAFFLFQVYLNINPQFTVVAGELALAAAVWGLGVFKLKKLLTVAVLLFLGSQLRFDAVLMVFSGCSPVLVCSWLNHRGSLKRNVLWMSAIFAVIIGVHKLEKNIYNLNSEWTYYQRFNATRGVIADNLSKERSADVLSDSWKKEQYLVMCRWGLADGKILSINEMNRCADNLKQYWFHNLKRNAKMYYRNAGKHAKWIFLIWFLITGVALLKKGQYKLFCTLMATIVVLSFEALYCFIVSSYRERILICLLFSLSFALSFVTIKIDAINKKYLDRIIGMVALLIGINCLIISIKSKQVHNEQIAETMALNTFVASINDAKMFILVEWSKADIYSISSTPSFRKYLAGGWLLNCPLNASIYSGYPSLLAGIPIVLEKDNETYKKNIEIIERTLNQYYHRPCRSVLYRSDGKYEVYKIVPITER